MPKMNLTCYHCGKELKGRTMKTSELKRILREDCAEVFTESENAIYNAVWTVWKKERQLVVRRVIPLGVLTVLGKYHNTPISEREDEKKYRIELFEKVNAGLETKYLKYDTSKMKFYFSDNVNENNQFKTTYTQQEIDNFPKEIKGAIECGFLRKVEVE